MSGRVTFLVALLLLARVAAARESGPPPECATYPYPSIPSLQICTQIDQGPLSQPGGVTTWRIRVRSGWKPILVRLHNASPRVVHVEGGNDQVRHMGCLRHHEAELRVTSIGPGAPQLDVKPYDPSPRKEASSIAASLAPRLARIEAEFRERQGRLESSPDDSAEAVEALLNTTESELLQALNYQELAALRDYVRMKFQDAQATLSSARSARNTSAFRSPVVIPARFQGWNSMGPERLPKRASSSVLGDIGRRLRQLYEMAVTDDMIVNVCVTSAPETGHHFEMHPQSYNRPQVTLTTGEISNVYRGIYIYGLTQRKTTLAACSDARQCPAIDLVDKPPLVYCDLNDRSCIQRSDLKPEKVCHGHRS